MNSTNQPQHESSNLDSRVIDALAEYCGELEGSQPESRESFLLRHAPIARELSECLAAFELVRTVSPSLPERDVTSDSPEPMNLGEFRVIREIGRGGMGIVFEAEQQSLQRRVALKVLPFAALLDERRLARFRNEARAAAMLKHPNIVDVYSVGCERGVHFYAMELIEGKTLAAISTQLHDQQKTVDPNAPSTDTCPVAEISTQYSTDRNSFYRSVAKLGNQAAKAIHFGHTHGVAHRDIKPSNLMVSNNGTIYVTDFGLAHIQMEDDLTMTGDLLGTFRYMSPEQLDTDTMADHRSDVYALGLTIYELIAGRPAIQGTTRETMLRLIIDGKIDPLEKLDHRLPKDLQTIIEKATARDPSDRYQTAEMLANDLQNFIDHRPVIASSPSQLRRLRRWASRNPRTAILGSATAALLVLVSILSVLFALNERSHREQQQSLIGNLREQEYDQAIHGVHLATHDSQFQTALKMLERVGRNHPERRNTFEYRFLSYRLQAVRVTPAYQRWVDRLDVCFSPNGDYIACSGWDGSVTMLDSSTSREIWNQDRSNQADNHLSYVRSIAFTPDGQFLVSAGTDGNFKGAIKVWKSQTGQQVESFSFKDQDPLALAIAPDGKTIFVGMETKPSPDQHELSIAVFELTKSNSIELRKIASIPTPNANKFQRLSISTSGKYLAAAANTNELLIWNLDGYKRVPLNDFHVGQIRSVDFSPTDDNRLAVSVCHQRPSLQGSDVYTINISDERRNLVRRLSAPIQAIKWGPDGTDVAIAASRNVEIMDTGSGTIHQTIEGHSGSINSLAFSPDGEQIASASEDGSVRIRSTSASLGAVSDYVCTGGGFGLALAFSADNEYLHAGFAGGQYRKWNLATGELVDQSESDGGLLWAIDFFDSPDAPLLVQSLGTWPPSEKPGFFKILPNESLPKGREYIREPFHSSFDVRFVPPKGDLIATTYRNGVQFWDVATGSMAKEFRDKSTDEITKRYEKTAGSFTRRIDFDQFGKYVAVVKMGTGAAVYVWRIGSGELIYTREGAKGYATALSEDGTLLAYDLDTIRITRIPSGERVLDLPGHLEGTYDLDFSPDGTRLLSAGKDGMAYVWNLSTGNRVLSFDVGNWIQRAMFSPDGKKIAIASRDTLNNGIVRVIDIGPDF